MCVCHPLTSPPPLFFASLCAPVFAAGYFVGVSAATGDLADNHDIISLVLADAPALTDEERKEAEKMEAEDVSCWAGWSKGERRGKSDRIQRQFNMHTDKAHRTTSP